MLFKWFWWDKSVTVPVDGSVTDKSRPFQSKGKMYKVGTMCVETLWCCVSWADFNFEHHGHKQRTTPNKQLVASTTGYVSMKISL
jgi:hypothetical protein